MPLKDIEARRAYDRERAKRPERRLQKAASYRRHIGTKVDYQLRKAYSLTLAEYEVMLVEQGGLSAICRGDDPGRGKRWNVDHDHRTGKVRGLLCHLCNRTLGTAHDNPETLRSAAEYLEKTA